MKKRLLCMMLAAVMLVSLMPAAFADDNAVTNTTEADGYEIINHTIGEWDILIRVCESYGLNFYSIKGAIMKLNGYTDEKQMDVLTPGRIIKLPATEADAKKIMSASVSGTTGGSGSSGSAASGSVVSYVVKSGDTFISICEAHGLNFFAVRNQLMQLNGFKSASQLERLYVGQTVKLPGTSKPGSSGETEMPSEPTKPSEPETPAKPSEPETPAAPAEYKTIEHTISDSDILIRVCNKYGMNFFNVKDAIMKLNGYTSERQLDILSPGKIIKLPATEADAKLIVSSTAASKPAAGGDTGSTGSNTSTGETTAYYLIPYTFQPGDTVYNLCISMGIDFEKNSELIKKLNSIKDYSRIANGKVLLMPSQSPADSGYFYKIVAHKIVSGETSESIAASYGMDHSKILPLMKIINGRDSFEMIYAGATLYIPVYCKA